MKTVSAIILTLLLAGMFIFVNLDLVPLVHAPARETYLTGFGGAQGVAIGDFNNDGLNEIAVSEGPAGRVTVETSNETIVKQFLGLDNPFGVAIGDVNNDGQNEIAIAETNGSRVTVYKSDGTVVKQFLGLSEPAGVAIGDFDNDHLNEIAIADSGNNKVYVLRSDGTAVKIWDGLSQPMGVAIGDYDNLGLNEIAITETYPVGRVTVYADNGTTIVGNWADRDNSTGVAIGDFNNDGRNELAFTEVSKLTIESVPSARTQGITRVQGNARGTSTSNNISVTMDSTPTSGDLEIAVIATRYGGAPPLAYVSIINQTGVTWTQQVNQSASSQAESLEIWAGVVGPGASANIIITLTQPADIGGVADVCEYSGLSANFLDKTASAAGIDMTYLLTGATTATTLPNELWIGATMTCLSGYNQSNPINGFTLLDGSYYNYVTAAFLEKIATSTGIANSGTSISYGSNIVYVGCIATFKARGPIASFNFEPAEPAVNETITFNASTSYDSDGTIVSYSWNFGDGTGLAEAEPSSTHFYNAPGSYNVSLTVTDDGGLDHTVTTQLIVSKMPSEITIVADPPEITIGENSTISGAIFPKRPEANVTVWCRFESEDWSSLANLTTDLNGEYQYNWVPSKTGTYMLRVNWTGEEYTLANESAIFDFNCMNISSSISIQTSSASTYVGYEVNVTGTLMDMYNIPVSNETVVLSYTFSGITTWTPITSDETDSSGGYSATWIPPATGNFIIKAEWASNATHSTTDSIAALNALPFANQYVFSVESNSTITGLAFNTTSQELSFTASGPSGTTGYAKVTIAKSLVSNITNIGVYLDNNQTEYSIASTDDSWLLVFNYTHSTHTIRVDLIASAVPEFSGVMIPLLLLISLAAAVLVAEKRKTRKAAQQSGA